MSRRSTHVLVTNPYLTPLRFAQRLTPVQYSKFLAENAPYIQDTEFAVVPYTQSFQRKLKALAKTGVWYI